MNQDEKGNDMKGKKTLLAGLITACLILPGCSSSLTPAMIKPDESILNSFQNAIVDKNNDFGFNLYKELNTDGENIMISPTSVAMALTMTYNGAREDTKEAMAEAMNIQGIEIENLNENNLALLYFLTTADPKVTLSIANSVWLKPDFEFSSDFVDEIENYYQAAAQELDFSNADAAKIMNNWVKKNTQGRIDKIVTPPVDPATVMFLINAVYFKGEWTNPFNKELTTDKTFNTMDGQTVTVPMMFKAGSFDFFKGQGFQALRLPYGEEERMAMYLFLPDEDSTLEQFQSQLNAENWVGWLPFFEKKQGTILLPRFTMGYEKSLNEALTSLGMGIAFKAGSADFSGMTIEDSSHELYISEVKHKTFLKVDEAGTEAAAVTSVGVEVTSVPEYDFNLAFDRPFFFVIQDSETGAIIFMGSVSDPSK